LFCVYQAGNVDKADASTFESFSEVLMYNRALTGGEKDVVINDYLSNKYIDFTDRPVVTAFTVTNIANLGTINNGGTVEFSLTLSDARTLKSIIIMQTTNGTVAANTAPVTILAGNATSFVLTVPPFYAQANNRLAVFAVDELGRVSDYVYDTAVNFTITNI